MRTSSVNHWMPFHIGDYLRDTMHLTTQQHGAYLLLLASYWTRQGPLPDDDATLAAIAKLSRADWARIKPTIAMFFRIDGGLWHQKRADYEIQHAAQLSAKRQQAGKRSGLARRATSQQPVSNSRTNDEQNARPLQLQPQPQGGSPLTPLAASPDLSEGERESVRNAEAIWSLYPKKRGTMDGLSAIMAALQRDGFETVLNGTRAVVEAYKRRGHESVPGQYLPRADQFFSLSCYKDDPAQYAPRQATLDAGDLRRVIDDLTRQVSEHPGNPGNAEGSFERKTESRDEWRKLRDQLREKRAELNALITTP